MEYNNVLFVDDELKVLSSIKRAVITENFKSYFATSAEKALEFMENNTISVIVTDMRMPVMDGLKLLKIIKEKYPDTIRIVLSGYSQLAQILATVNGVGVFKFITKPWSVDEDFLPAIIEGIEYYNLKKASDQLKTFLEDKSHAYNRILKTNTDTVLNNKIDIENIKNINNIMFKIINLIITDNAKLNITFNEIEHYIKIIYDIYFGYLNTLPSKYQAYNLTQLTEDLNKTLSENNKITCIDELKYHGNYSLLVYISKELFSHVLRNFKEEEFSVNLLNESSISIILDLSKKEEYDNTEINLVTYFLNGLSSILKGKIIHSKIEKKIIFTINCDKF
ncbi:response regulator [Clostridium sp. FP2]|uniref:response regulator n=1 Tax=Clostridium TaxID=1485 RepID=UPI0013E95E54|nr:MULTISPECIES: response regulator [Clostridium]MBW9157743.1 response regulator [Clostridium tagluense]MBZ9622514.1 response regulator [Clostridium sp. FP2]WLC66805.1 response regulator [Clostridium tagluense]